MRIFIVQGVHPTTPGIVRQVFAEHGAAVDGAVALINTIAGKQIATPRTWQAVLAKLQKQHEGQECDVWIDEQELIKAPPTAAETEHPALQMLRKIVDYSAPSAPDSTGQAMRRIRKALVDQAQVIIDEHDRSRPAADAVPAASTGDADEAAARAAGWTHGVLTSTYPTAIIYRARTDAEAAAAAPGANRQWISAASWREACEQDGLSPDAPAKPLKPLTGPDHGPSLSEQLRLLRALAGTQNPVGISERNQIHSYVEQLAAQMLSSLQTARDVLAEYAAVAPAGCAADALRDVEAVIVRAEGRA